MLQRNYKNNLKNRESQTNKQTNTPPPHKILRFEQDFKSESVCFLYLYSVQAAGILDLSLEIKLSPPK